VKQSKTTLLGVIWLLLRREIAVEAADRQTVATVAPFVAVVVLAAGLSFGPRTAVLAATGPGVIWLVVLITAVPLAPIVAVTEASDGAWDLLRGLCAPGPLFIGKLVAMWLRLVLGWGLATALAAALFATSPRAPALAAGLLGTLGVAALTVLLGTVLPASTRRPALLAVLLLPAALPALIAGVQAATADASATPWLALLGVFDVLTLTVAWAVYPALLED
jgi:heme exporter protein B